MLHVGDTCIFDMNNEQGLRIHEPVLVRITKRIGLNKFEVIDLSTMQTPLVYKDRYYGRNKMIVEGKHLTKSQMTDRIVIRASLKSPIILDDDLQALSTAIDALQEGKRLNGIQLAPLKALFYKLNTYKSIGGGIR